MDLKPGDKVYVTAEFTVAHQPTENSGFVQDLHANDCILLLPPENGIEGHARTIPVKMEFITQDSKIVTG